MRIERRKDQRECPSPPELALLSQRGRLLLHLFIAEILSFDKTAKYDAWIQGIRRDVAVFISRIHRPPIMKIQRTVSAAARRTQRVAILLSAVDPVRKLVVRNHVIKLRGRLVKPGAPRLPAVAR